MADNSCDDLGSSLMNPFKCSSGAAQGLADKAGDAVGNAVSSGADAVLKDIIKGWSEAVSQFLRWLNEWWMDTPSTDVNSSPVQHLVTNLSWYTAALAMVGFFIGLIRLLMHQDQLKEQGIALARPMVNLVLATTIYGAGLPLLIKASDGLAKWLLEKTNDGGTVDISTLVSVNQMTSLTTGLGLILVLLLLLGSLMNFAFMIFRNVMFLILAAFLPTIAAVSGTETGGQAWRKANGWLLAMLLFKPVAAGIFALGIYATHEQVLTKEGQDQFGGDLVTALVGVLILGMAGLALPALVKFVVPAAGAGAGAFSGGAAAAGVVTVAAGAAVLGSGGAGAATAGGASPVASTPPMGTSTPSPGGGGAGTSTGAPTTPTTSTGAEGPAGANGAGSQGPTGGDGAGSQGPAGATGEGTEGATGTAGTAGEGTEGAAGPAGATGEGTQGAAGAVGAAGAGSEGRAGASGVSNNAARIQAVQGMTEAAKGAMDREEER